jgi:hypothetical protein
MSAVGYKAYKGVVMTKMEYNRAYYQDNKMKMDEKTNKYNEKRRALKAEISARRMAGVDARLEGISGTINIREIASTLNVTMPMMRVYTNNPAYIMPRPVAMGENGVVLYDTREINLWLMGLSVNHPKVDLSKIKMSKATKMVISWAKATKDITEYAAGLRKVAKGLEIMKRYPLLNARRSLG